MILPNSSTVAAKWIVLKNFYRIQFCRCVSHADFSITPFFLQQSSPLITVHMQTALRNKPASVAIEGILFTCAPLPFLLLATAQSGNSLSFPLLTITTLTAFAWLAAALLLLRSPRLGKLIAVLAIAGCAAIAWPYGTSAPLPALVGGVTILYAVNYIREFRSILTSEEGPHPADRSLQRLRGSLWTTAVIAFSGLLIDNNQLVLRNAVSAAALLISLGLLLHWLSRDRRTTAARRFVVPLLVTAGGAFAFFTEQIHLAVFLATFCNLGLLPRTSAALDHPEQPWELFLHHPARVLLSTFFALCLLGTLLLQLPWATTAARIPPIDAAFTSVSAVCVTGLTVLDTGRDFTLFGQWCLVLLIQLGGFGIMTISTVAFHAMGKRLSLRQERVLTELTETSHRDVVQSLLTIVRFTLACEAVGALLLTASFWQGGVNFSQALWKGVFTAISAFCNAGFALDSSSLLPYQSNPLVLHTVAALIIAGGLAPATSLLLPRWLNGRPIALAPRIALLTSITLLVSGSVVFLVLEWNGLLTGLSLSDKFHNAWFQSVTLRTAGFNSVDLPAVTGPTFLIMLIFMFIGGSPGGTAGGIKTTTAGVLAMTFWASITGQQTVVAQHRCITQETINRAITIVCSGLLVWSGSVLALLTTQNGSTRDLVFEVTSALGTVGLTLGATAQLDEIGKIIIILTMFTGRIGPMTLFTLLSLDSNRVTRYPEARITLN